MNPDVNWVCNSNSISYTYDADSRRVRKSSGSTGTLYWYMTAGIVGESDLSGNLTDEYVFFGGERVARKSTNGVFYYFSDHLKTASVITDSAGNIKSESDFYPWGGELQFINNDSNHYKFTGKERDAETQLDYFGARHYSNGLGRWVSADWNPTPIPVPYADFHNPQTLNLYGFVGGNPASKADPDGHADDGQKHDIAKPVPMSDCVVCTGFKTPSNIQSQNDAGVQRRLSDIGIGLLKEGYNTVQSTTPSGPLFSSDLEPSNPTQANTMKAAFVFSLFIGVGEEKTAVTLERKVTTVAEKAIIKRLTAEAEKLYPKLAGKIQGHHEIPRYLGGPKNGPVTNLNAAYHQLITNAFREIAPYGKKFEGSLQKVLENIYSRFPLP